SRRRGGDDSDSHQAGATKLIKSESTGAKARPNVAAVGRVEVPIVITDQPRARDPATAAQHFVIAEPGLRILFVWPRNKPRIGIKYCRSPLPDIANHLPATECAVARGQC